MTFDATNTWGLRASIPKSGSFVLSTSPSVTVAFQPDGRGPIFSALSFTASSIAHAALLAGAGTTPWQLLTALATAAGTQGYLLSGDPKAPMQRATWLGASFAIPAAGVTIPWASGSLVSLTIDQFGSITATTASTAITGATVDIVRQLAGTDVPSVLSTIAGGAGVVVTATAGT